MDYKTLLGLTSALVGGSIVGGQDPSFEYPAVQPKAQSETILTRQSGLPAEHGTVTVAPLPELDRIVVAASKAAPLCESLTFDIPQDPQREKELKELGERMRKEFGPDSEFMKKLRQELGEAKKWQEHAKELQGKAGEHKMSEQDAKKWEQFHKEMEKRFGPGSEFEKKMKVWSDQHGKEMQKRFGPGSDFEKKMKAWSEQHGKQIEREFGPGSKFEKEMRAYKFENGQRRELTPQERAEFEKKMSEMRVKLQKMKLDLPKMPKGDFKFYAIPPVPEMPKMPALPEGSFKFRSLPAVPATPGLPAAPGARFSSGDLMDVAKSLTPAQREKNKSQGFLYWSDLTRDQQGKLGASGWSGNWMITYSKDGETFTVKSDRK